MVFKPTKRGIKSMQVRFICRLRAINKSFLKLSVHVCVCIYILYIYIYIYIYLFIIIIIIKNIIFIHDRGSAARL